MINLIGDVLTMDLTGIKRVYFIGIGGSSMSSLAEILIGRGYTVAGSDMQESATVDHLRSFGADVTVGQKAENVERFAPDAVIKTDAIMDTNPELIYSKEHNIPVYRRAELSRSRRRTISGARSRRNFWPRAATITAWSSRR